MDSPYRTAPASEPASTPRDAGIVDEIVAQFGDPLAFYRELVQNAIDAGTAAVTIEVADDVAAEAIRVRVRDRGEGMDPDLLENQLLVLFRSTKERDPTKIGKFGIGFASVLAPGPRLVVVDTVRAGRRSILHLRPDLSFRIFDGGPATHSGTLVELELARGPLADTDFARRSGEALVRWCRHAAVPVHFVARDAAGVATIDVRIDRALDLEDAVIAVHAVSADGATRAVVGLTRGAAPYAGFFNRGLMLHETAAPLVGRVAFKVIDAGLGHTLSRDDVRRDRAFERCLALVRQVAARELIGAVAAALAETAEVDRVRWAALFEAAEQAELELDADAWVAPLCAPVADVRTVAVTRVTTRPIWAATAADPLVAALAVAGVPVLALAASSTWLSVSRIAARFDRAIETPTRRLTLVTEVTRTATDRTWMAALIDRLDEALRLPDRVVLATLHGARAGAVCVTGDAGDALAVTGDGRWILDDERAIRSPFGPFGRHTLVLAVDHPVVAAARAGAATAPVVAADVVARAILLQHRELDPARSARLLDLALAAVADEDAR